MKAHEFRKRALIGRNCLVFPPVYCPNFENIHPAIKILVIFLSASVSFFQPPLWKLLLITLFCLGLLFLFYKPRKLLLIFMTPITLLLIITGGAMYYFESASLYNILQYCIGVFFSMTVGFMIIFSARIADIAHGIEVILTPFRAIGLKTRTLSLGLVVAVRFFIVLLWSLVAASRAFKARGIKMSGLSAMSTYSGVLLIKAVRTVDDISVALISRGVDLSASTPLSLRSYSYFQSIALLMIALGISIWMLI